MLQHTRQHMLPHEVAAQTGSHSGIEVQNRKSLECLALNRNYLLMSKHANCSFSSATAAGPPTLPMLFASKLKVSLRTSTLALALCSRPWQQQQQQQQQNCWAANTLAKMQRCGTGTSTATRRFCMRCCLQCNSSNGARKAPATSTHAI
jgi:hypothetical protein